MKRLLLLIMILFSGFALSQDMKTVKKTIRNINQDKDYTIKTVPYDYFMDKNQTTDNGIELKGYYKNGKLKKMVHFVGLSAWHIFTDYFFSDQGQLIFVYSRKYQILDENGYMKNFKLLSEIRYYYKEEKLIKKVGIESNFGEKQDYVAEAKTLKKDLESYQ